MSISSDQILAALQSTVSKEEINGLIKEVLDRAKDEESTIHHFYLRCGSWSQIPGFRKGKVPPFSLLLNNAIEVIGKHSGAFFEFIAVLPEFGLEKATEIKEFIRSQFAEELEEQPQEIGHFRELTEQITARVQEDLNPDWGRARLLLTVGALLIISQAPQKEEIAFTKENPVSREILARLEGLPADDPFWTDVEGFYAAVNQMKGKKTKKIRIHEEVRNVLEKLRSRYLEHLNDYFQLDITSWAAEHLVTNQEGAVLSELEALLEQTDEHLEVYMATPQTMQERIELNERLSRLESRIAQRHKVLEQSFQVTVKIAKEKKGEELPEKMGEGEIKDTEEKEWQKRGTQAEQRINSAELSKLHEKPALKGKEGTSLQVTEETEPVDPVTVLVLAGDLSGAFWKARALEETAMPGAVPSWLLAAMESARYLLRTDFGRPKDFTYPLKHCGQDGSRFVELGSLGAGLIATLLVPASGAMGWLFDQENLPSLQKMITLIKEFSYRNIALSKNDLLFISNKDRWDETVREASNHCQATLNNNVGRRFGLPRVNNVWQGIFGEGSELRTILAKAAADGRKDLVEIKKVLQQWATSDQIADQLSGIDLRPVGRKSTPLANYERGRLIRAITDVVDSVEQWVNLAEHTMDGADNWKQKHMEQLVADLEELLQPTLTELVVAAEGADYEEKAGYLYIRENLRLLQSYITSGVDDISRGSWYLKGDNLESILAKRLLHYPELTLRNDCLPTDSDLEYLATFNMAPLPCWRLLSKRIFQEWLAKQDHRFLDDILLGMDEEDAEKDKLKTLASKQLQGSRDTLEYQAGKTIENIERALVNSVIEEDYRVSFLTVVEGIEPEIALNFRYEFAKLAEVDQKLEEATKLRIEHLNELWERLSPSLEESAETEDAKKFREMIEGAREKNDTRVMAEYLARLREHVDQGEDLSFSQIYQQSRNYLNDFYHFEKAWNEVRMRNSLMRGRLQDSRRRGRPFITAIFLPNNWSRLTRHLALGKTWPEEVKLAFGKALSVYLLSWAIL